MGWLEELPLLSDTDENLASLVDRISAMSFLNRKISMIIIRWKTNLKSEVFVLTSSLQ